MRTDWTTMPSRVTRSSSPTATTSSRCGSPPASTIWLEHAVHRVHWSDQGVTLEGDRGDVTADRAVLTVPVGVLKSAAFTIEPPLPEPVAGALARLEMNAFEKVFLRFPTKFWDDGVYAIRQQGPAGVWWHSWYDLTALHGEPTLLTFAAGPCAVETRGLERGAGSRVGARGAAKALRGRRAGADAVHVTHWQDDPYARGSYAYMTVGSTPADHDLLATPVGGVLHLSGEATWTDGPGDGHRCPAVGAPRCRQHPRPGDPDRPHLGS